MSESRWECPACGRSFGRIRQGHVCVPTRSLDDFLNVQGVAQRAIFEAVISFASGLEGTVIEAGDSDLMLKRKRKFAALTPRRKWVRMWFIVPRVIEHGRIMSRTKSSARGGVAHFMQLAGVGDVDETLRGWLTESFEAFD